MEVVLRLNVTLHWAPSSFFHDIPSHLILKLDWTHFMQRNNSLFLMTHHLNPKHLYPSSANPYDLLQMVLARRQEHYWPPFFHSVACKIYKNRPTRQYARCICSLIDFFGHKPCPECVRRALIVVRLQFLFQTCSILSLLSDAPPPSTLG